MSDIEYTALVPPGQRKDPPRGDRRVRLRVSVHHKTSLPGVEGLLRAGEHTVTVYETDLPAIQAKVEDRQDAWQDAIRSCHEQWRDFLESKGKHADEIAGDPARWPDDFHRLIKGAPEIAGVCPEKVFYEMSRNFPDVTYEIHDRSGRVRIAHQKSGEWLTSTTGKPIRPTKRGRLPLDSVEVVETLPSPLDEERHMRMEAESAHASTLAAEIANAMATAMAVAKPDSSDDEAPSTTRPRRKR